MADPRWRRRPWLAPETVGGRPDLVGSVAVLRRGVAGPGPSVVRSVLACGAPRRRHIGDEREAALSWHDRDVPSLFASYLRVYEPLTAFDRERQVYWRRYVKEGRAVAPLEGPG